MYKFVCVQMDLRLASGSCMSTHLFVFVCLHMHACAHVFNLQLSVVFPPHLGVHSTIPQSAPILRSGCAVASMPAHQPAYKPEQERVRTYTHVMFVFVCMSV